MTEAFLLTALALLAVGAQRSADLMSHPRVRPVFGRDQSCCE
jgi:hypothetical protein